MTTKGEIVGGFVIRPARLTKGEEIEREHAAYRKFAFGLIDLSGLLIRTSTRLIWTSAWLVKSISRDEVIDVSLHHKWGIGPFGHWSVRVKTRSKTDFFRLKPSSVSTRRWAQAREKEAATRWVTMVKHWADC